MSGERDLKKLLAGLKVFRHEGVWEFVSGTQQGVAGAVMQFSEQEGWTHIVPAHRAAAPEARFIWLELKVHSDLNAVGFLAVISAALAKAGVPCNCVSAFYHDHIFVPEDHADIAINAIEALKT